MSSHFFMLTRLRFVAVGQWSVRTLRAVSRRRKEAYRG